jgi:hypothetical protein
MKIWVVGTESLYLRLSSLRLRQTAWIQKDVYQSPRLLSEKMTNPPDLCFFDDTSISAWSVLLQHWRGDTGLAAVLLTHSHEGALKGLSAGMTVLDWKDVAEALPPLIEGRNTLIAFAYERTSQAFGLLTGRSPDLPADVPLDDFFDSIDPIDQRILNLMLEGHKHTVIADRLEVSQSTVSRRVRALVKDFQLGSVAEMLTRFSFHTQRKLRPKVSGRVGQRRICNASAHPSTAVLWEYPVMVSSKKLPRMFPSLDVSAVFSMTA